MEKGNKPWVCDREWWRNIKGMPCEKLQSIRTGEHVINTSKRKKKDEGIHKKNC